MGFNKELRLTIPANTPASAPVRVTYSLPEGSVIDDLRLHVPKGHQALVPVWLEMDFAKFLPTGPEVYRLDNISDRPIIRHSVPNRRSRVLALVGYNEDPVNEHTTTVSVIGRFARDLSFLERLRL